MRELLFEEWTLKLIAAAITLGLWYGVTERRAPATMRVRNVALSFLLPENMEISNDPREQVEVTLSGKKEELAKLVAGNLVVTVDVRGYQEGERVARLVPENVTMNLPDGNASILKIEPGTVPLKLERRIERRIEVKPDFLGAPTEGYELRRVEVTPRYIIVRGPASRVQTLEHAPTETITLEGRRESFTLRQVAVDIKDEKVVPLDGVVTVQVLIGAPLVERRFTGVTARLATQDGEEPRGAPPIAVVLRGERAVVESIVGDELLVLWRPEEGADAGRVSNKLVPRVVLPPGLVGKVEVVGVEPARLDARL